MFLESIQDTLVTGIGAADEGFSESTSGAMSMLTKKESSILLISSNIVRNNVAEGDVGFLAIDDSLSKKDKFTKKIEGLDYHHSHSDGKTMCSHCAVTSHYKISDYSLPQNFKLYLRKKFFGNKA